MRYLLYATSDPPRWRQLREYPTSSSFSTSEIVLPRHWSATRRMEAACRGAKTSSKYQAGDTVGIVPGHDPHEANPHVDIAIASGLDHVRNSVVAHCDAVVAIGGGAGTLSEICFAWIYKRLVIGFRVPGWSGKLADTRLDDRTRYPDIAEDRIHGADSAEDAVSLITRLLPHHDGQHHGVRRRRPG